MMLERLAIEIAALEREVPVAEVRLETADRLCTALQRAHLPKLADESIIEYDESMGTVVLTEAAIEREPLGDGGERDD